MDSNRINFEKGNGLVPCIIQDSQTKNVLMLGYMDKTALEKTISDQIVTFWSRSKNRLWTKGEESGNFLQVRSMSMDCDNDTLLIMVVPKGPTCHTGTDTCWGQSNLPNAFLFETLQSTIQSRKEEKESKSYTASLFQKGINKIAQKVGEEAVELVIESKDDNDDLFLNEAADLMYHFIVLLVAKGFTLSNVVAVLKSREK